MKSRVKSVETSLVERQLIQKYQHLEHTLLFKPAMSFLRLFPEEPQRGRLKMAVILATPPTERWGLFPLPSNQLAQKSCLTNRM